MPFLFLSRDPVTREMFACLRDADHIPRAAELWTLTRLPPHIRIGLEGPSLGIVHSEEMTGAMVALAKNRALTSLTVLVGLGHAEEIAHYLQMSDSTT